MTAVGGELVERKPRKILLVDDSEVIRETVAMMLEEQGYTVICLDSVFSFSPTLQRERPDLALVDVGMPALRGDQLVGLARHRPYVCPLVLFSDRPAEELRVLGTACGAAGFIRKTSDGEALARDIEGIIRNATPPPGSSTPPRSGTG